MNTGTTLISSFDSKKVLSVDQLVTYSFLPCETIKLQSLTTCICPTQDYTAYIIANEHKTQCAAMNICYGPLIMGCYSIALA